MEYKSGMIVHIKEEYYNRYNKYNLMINHNFNHISRPVYLLIVKDKTLWAIPLSSKIRKYERIIIKKIKLYKKCSSIMMLEINNKKSALLLQNSFPIRVYDIKCPSYIRSKPIVLPNSIQKKIRNNFKTMLSLKKEGLNLFFTDIDSILKELDHDKSK